MGEWVSPHYKFIYAQTWAWKEEPFVLKHIVVIGKFHHHCCNNAPTKLRNLSKYECACVCVCVCVLVSVCMCVFMSIRENIVFFW